MACFVAPATTAIVTTVLKKKISPKYHVEWLLAMQWGGVLMLIVDHISTGEVVSYFPFFTASWSEIWPEILRVGIPMAVVVFGFWITAVQISWAVEKRKKIRFQTYQM